jgi:fucose 4-O-acetylase-like acetyltransferase
MYQYSGGPISMARGRLDSRFELGSLIQEFDTRNMIFWKKTSEIKTNHKIFYEEREFFQIFLLRFLKELMYKEAGVKIDLPHID